jgi:trk system potassium uptake protein TrkH
MGTVGLSMSMTPTLTAASKIILMVLMYAGRVGILTIALAFGEKKDTVSTKRPLDNILIG